MILFNFSFQAKKKQSAIHSARLSSSVACCSFYANTKIMSLKFLENLKSNHSRDGVNEETFLDNVTLTNLTCYVKFRSVVGQETRFFFSYCSYIYDVLNTGSNMVQCVSNSVTPACAYVVVVHFDYIRIQYFVLVLCPLLLNANSNTRQLS